MTNSNLGLCEDCAHMRRLRPTTLDGSPLPDLIAYCERTKHDTKGCVKCRLFRERRVYNERM